MEKYKKVKITAIRLTVIFLIFSLLMWAKLIRQVPVFEYAAAILTETFSQAALEIGRTGGSDGGAFTKVKGENGVVASEPEGYMGEGAVNRSDGLSKALVSVEDERPYSLIPMELKYDRYPLTTLYLLVENPSAVIFKEPAWDSPQVREAEKREKLSYVETVTMETGVWYHVSWYEDESGTVLADGSEEGTRLCFGFVWADSASRRQFQFQKMEEALKRAQWYFESGQLTYISNYKNYHGEAPQYYGKDFDAGGNPRNQSAPAYLSPYNLQEFVYLEDGTLVRNLDYDGEYMKVQVVKNDQVYYVPKKYIPYPKSLSDLTKVIVVDRENQNEVSYEKKEGEWIVTSYSLATTGTKNEYADPTPLGYYYLMEKKPEFLYYRDGTYIIDGYAPYALRFNGGAYIHGVSTAYEWSGEQRSDPGKREFSSTLGTIPLSHKCVRNITSHAEFLYEWYEPGKTIVIVIE